MNDKQQWFEAQCIGYRICAEDIFVVGDYATNKEGDLLFLIKEDGADDMMEYVQSSELIDSNENYAEWQLYAWQKVQVMRQTIHTEVLHKDDDKDFGYGVHTPWDFAQVFHECVCRNKALSEDSREVFRKKDAVCVIVPAIDVDSQKGTLLALCGKDVLRDLHAILPEEIDNAKGYRFALKLVNFDEFLARYSCIKSDGRHGPFKILSDLEEAIKNQWDKNHKVFTLFGIFMYDDMEKEDDYGKYYKSAFFRFSHFEIESELDENYRTIYVCYKEVYAR